MKSRKSQTILSRDTLAIHAGHETREADTPVVAPLFQSANFIQEFGTAELRYPRYGNSPNAEIVQARVAALEGSEAACFLASGQGATVCALMALLRPGDHVVTSAWIYGGTQRFLCDELTSLGVEVSLVTPTESRVWRKSLKKNTRVLFLETPVNPTCRVLDLRPISHIAHEAGLALVVDSTFASPINFRPLEHGADVVVHSATKYLNGHHDILGGMVCGTAPYVDEVRQKMLVWGQAPDPFAAWLLERGLKTLAVRIQRHNENAMAVATWCAEQKQIRTVHYSGLPSHPDHETAKTCMDGFGGMLAIELAGGSAAADRLVRKLKLFRYAPSLGGVDSLVSDPRYTSHVGLSDKERAAVGIGDGFLRLSVGIESANDLISDLDQALS
jgi:cystathionine beta-lyase/cystathionine gamma-synthase